MAGIVLVALATASTAQVTVKDAGGSDTTIPLDAPAGHEAIVTQATFDAGQVIKTHRHLGIEVITGVDGVTTVQMENQRPRLVRAGESLLIPAGTYHQATAGPSGAKVVIFRIHPTGQPLRIRPDRPVRFPE